MQSHHVILKPIVSEKSFKEAGIGRYTFVVSYEATKTDIKRAVEELFGVKVVGVLTNTIKGSKTRTTRYGKRTVDSSYKKARVKLAEGQRIAIFEEEGEEEKKESKKRSKKEEKVEKEAK